MKPIAHRCRMGRTILCIAFLQIAMTPARQIRGQENAGPVAQNVQDSRYSDLEKQVQVVASALKETRQQLKESEQRIDQLQAELNRLRGNEGVAADNTGQSPAPDLAAAVAGLKDESDILQSQVKQLDQAKVETSSKFPLRLTGMILLNAFANDGAVDNMYLPTVALPRTGDLVHNNSGASMSQTILGLDAFGPKVWGAHSSADIQFDFFNASYGTSSPSSATARFRTAHVGLDWGSTTVSAGIDTPFISPLNPTSYATVAIGAMTWSGNLWLWMPQVEVEKRISNSATSYMGLQIGVLDPGYVTLPNVQTGTYASQTSPRPGYESRISYNWNRGLDRFGIGVGSYYARTEYKYDQNVNSWAVTADWNLPLRKWALFSGELYRGSAIGQLGGGAFKNVLSIPNADRVRGIDAEGGWSQLKFRFTPQFEGNVAIGQDTGFGSQIRAIYTQDPTSSATTSPYYYLDLARNRTIMENIIYHPRTYLLFSAEHRNIETWPVTGVSDKAQNWTLSAGYLF